MPAAALVFVVYLLIGTAAYWPVYPGISQHLFSNEQDFTQTIWFLDWVPYALAHGLNPFFSHSLYVPTGVNLAQNTSTPLLGWITAPLSLVSSPVVRANLLMVLAMPLSATAAFVVLRKWLVWGPAAALGGLIYGFSPYMVNQSVAHLGLIFVPLPPFIALTVASVLRGRGSPRRLGVQLGLLVVAQFLISPEILASVVIFTVAAVACVAIRAPANLPTMLRTASGAAGTALVVTVVLLAYPIWMMSFGPQHFTGPPGPTTNSYHSDLLSFVVPAPQQRFSLGMRSLGSRLSGNGAGGTNVEGGSYIGIPLLIITGFFAWSSRRGRRMQLTVVLLLGSALLSLGPQLAVDGRLTGIPLPFWLLDHLPLVNGLLPGRITFEMGACLAAVIAFGLDDVRHTPGGTWIRKHAGPVCAALTLVVLVATQLPEWPGSYASEPAVALPAVLTRAIPVGDPVAITYPYDTARTNSPMLWQAEDDFRFRLLGGYAYHVFSGHPSLVPNPMDPPGLQQFLAYQEGVSIYGPETPISPKLVADTVSAVSNYDIRLVIVDRSFVGSPAVMALFTDALGPPALSAGHFSMWANWHGRPKHEQFTHHLSTVVVLPTNDADMSGKVLLSASATGFYSVTRVEFLMTDEAHHTTLIATGRPTLFGWLASWATTSVANGTYSLQSSAYDAFGAHTLSRSITITVMNR